MKIPCEVYQYTNKTNKFSLNLLTRLICFIALTLSSLTCLANIEGKWTPSDYDPPTGSWEVNTEVISYLYNYEWLGTQGTNGYTLFGSILPIYAANQLNEYAKLEAGTVSFIRYGAEPIIKPFLRLTVDLGNKQNLILGALNQSHDISQTLSLDNDLYKQQLEQGIQFISHNTKHSIDTWINWKTAETSNTTEYFEVAGIYHWNAYKKNNLNLYTNSQFFISHRGGQITSDDRSVRGAWGHMQVGSSLNGHDFSLKLLTSNYKDNLINKGSGYGLEATYNKSWLPSSHYAASLAASYFSSNNFYTELGHPGYNNPFFSQLSMNIKWLKGKDLSISTGLSLDLFNNSLSTTQYLNVSLYSI